MLMWPVIASVGLVFIHGYFGAFVLRRGIIFIDLALAQWAALGGLVGYWMGIHSPILLFLMGVGFTLLASGFLVITRPLFDRLNMQEASIGVIYVMASTLAMTLIASTGMDGHHLKNMLTGHWLFVQPMEVVMAMGVYAGIGGILWRLQGALLTQKGYRLDMIFYALFGVVVTSSVKMVGILLVFSFLVIPMIVARLFVSDLNAQLKWGWMIGLFGVAMGVGVAVCVDIPLSLCVIIAYLVIFLLAVASRWRQMHDGGDVGYFL